MIRIMALILATFLVLSITACGGGNGNGNEELPPRENNEPTDSREAEPTPPSETTDTPSGEINNLTTLYVDGWGFSDSVAWVMSEEDWNLNWHLIDKTGKIQLTLETGDNPFSDFSQSVALIRRSDGTIELINKSGNVVSSPKTGDYDEIISFIHEHGMIIVSKHINMLQLTETQVGIIDSKGNWQLSLQRNDLLLNSANMGHYEGEFFARPSYIGSGILDVSYSINAAHYGAFFNIFTGTTTDSQTDFSHYEEIIRGLAGSVSSRMAGWTNTRNFENGYGVYIGNATEIIEMGMNSELHKGNIFSVNATGISNEIIRGINYKTHTYQNMSWLDTFSVIGEYRDGLFYFSDKDIGGVHQGFFDINGNKIIDLYDYIIWATPHFEDGYCLLFLRNEQNSEFYTIIDTSGKMCFEPKPSDSFRMSLTGGMLVRKEQLNYSESFGTSPFNIDIMNVYGESLMTLNNVIMSDFNNGMALVRTREGIYFIEAPCNLPRPESHQALETSAPPTTTTIQTSLPPHLFQG
jgi:predicted small lipoprotein YifL